MKMQQRKLYQCIRSALKIGGAAGVLALGSSAWAANDLDVTSRVTQAGIAGIDAKNMELLGWNDMQGRVIYQTTIHTHNTANGSRVIAYTGHFNAKMLNPMNGVVETNGVGIVDVTDPTNPIYLKHLPANNGGSRMIKLCDGNEPLSFPRA
jgi:hypothetical protein